MTPDAGTSKTSSNDEMHEIANPARTTGKETLGQNQLVNAANTAPSKGANTIKMGRCSVT